jgi:hypothetical protein
MGRSAQKRMPPPSRVGDGQQVGFETDGSSPPSDNFELSTSRRVPIVPFPPSRSEEVYTVGWEQV